MKTLPDLSIYLRAIPMLARRPSVFVAPLLGAVVALVLSEIATYLTAAIAGAGGGIFEFIADVFYGFVFGIAIIQADAIERGLPGSFDAAWEEGRRKGSGIVVAAIGFWFLIMIAEYVGQIFGLDGELLLLLVAAFFLIYTIPAAAIGGLPGTQAIGGSLRAVRANAFAAAILTIVFIILFEFLPPYIAAGLAQRFGLGNTVAVLVQSFLYAVALGYLAFPFAKQYADIAYRA